MIKAYSYIRMSTKQQLKGASLKRQLDATKKYAEEMGWVLDDSMRDIGISAYKGKNAKNGALGKFIQLCEDGTIKRGSVLIVENLDRISRQKPLKAFNLFTSILQHGITIVTLSDKKHFTEDSVNKNIGDIYVSIGTLIRAHEESEIKSDRLRHKWEEKKKNAKNQIITSRCPAWLSVSKDKKKFEILHERQIIIERIFNLLKDGIGKSVIIKILNEDKIDTFGKSVGWHASYIQKLYSQEAVIGTYQPYKIRDGIRIPDGDPIKNYYPPVISKTLYYKALKAVSERKISGKGRKGEKFSNLFSGIAKCNVCIGSMIYLNKGKPPKGGKYLTCSGARRGICENHKHFSYGDVEALILESLNELDISSLIKNETSASKQLESDIVVLDGELKGLVNKRKLLLRNFTDDEDATTISVIKELGEQEKTLRKKILAFKKKLKKINADNVDLVEVVRNVEALCKLIDKSEPAKVYEIRAAISAELRRIIRSLLFYKDGHIGIDTGDNGQIGTDDEGHIYFLEKFVDKKMITSDVNKLIDNFSNPIDGQFID
jgi:DNA invertase Pin-like site-specific DNA recombinase